MSYFDQISPSTPHRVLVDLTEFTSPWRQWRAEADKAIAEAEKALDAALGKLVESIGEDAYNALVTEAAKGAIADGKDFTAFPDYLPPGHDEIQALVEATKLCGKALAEAQAATYDGPKWTLQWAQIDTAAASRALKNAEIIQRHHPDWSAEQIFLLAYLAAHHQAQAGEPAPGEIYDTLASRAEFGDVWRYVGLRFREEFPEVFALDAATLKNVFCGRALVLAAAGTPQK